MITNKKQAEDFVYRSYMKAAKKLKYAEADSEKRKPRYTKAIIEQLDKGTENILVTGSKGKGSVSVMISAILQAHGKNIGLLTSPHINDFNERIRINNALIANEELIKYCNTIQPTIELIDMTIAENEYVSPIGIQVLIALLHFAGKTDYNIFECGKGVLYDDVNNLSRSYSVINKIFPEHTRELGGTLEAIARDKSHIITKGQRYAYTAAQTPEVTEILEKRAKECGVELKTCGRDFFVRNIILSENGTAFDAVINENEYKDINIPLLGAHQAENFALALAVCTDILDNADINSVKKAAAGIEWHGRLEIISKDPLTIVDACINRESARLVKAVLKAMPHKNTAAVIAVPSDKDYTGVAEEISEIAGRIIFTKAQNPHYRFEKSQAKCVKGGIWADNINKALMLAEDGADMVCVLGTTAVLTEILK